MSFKKAASYVFDLLFPAVCFCCKKDIEPLSKEPLCFDCIRKLEFIDKPYCLKCSKSLKFNNNLCYECREKRYYFDFSRSVFVYNEAISSLIKAYKYSSKEYLSDWFVDKMLERFRFYSEFYDFDCVTYLPTSKVNIKERGFDHSKLIAELFSKKTRREFISDVIENRKMIDQVNLNARMREENVRGKFLLKKDIFSKRKVIIIDDVATTMSSLNELSKVLKESGAISVSCFTIAREQL